MLYLFIYDSCLFQVRSTAGGQQHGSPGWSVLPSTNKLYALSGGRSHVDVVHQCCTYFIYNSVLFQVQLLQEASNLVALDGVSYQGNFIFAYLPFSGFTLKGG